MNDNQFTLRFSGVADLKPHALRAKELAEILESIEAAVATTVVSHDSTIKREQIALSLINITDESIGLAFAPNLPTFTFPALEEIALAITSQRLETLSYATLKALKPILRFVRERGCQAELKFKRAGCEITASLTPSTQIQQPQLIQGSTTIYGEVVRVGGVEPKVEIKTIDGKVRFCPTSQSLALQLAARLYQQVGVQGIASWNPETFEIEEFEITELLSYIQVSLPQAFQQLQESTNGLYDTIENVEEYVNTLRYDEE